MADPHNAFDTRILEIVGHRPWPMPASPWVMTQTWRHLLFAHWPIDAAMLRTRVPQALEIDRFDGQAWLGIVPLEMSNVAPRGVPAVDRFSTFPELNVRTYVRCSGVPGVYFFSLDASNRFVVAAARRLFHLPYHLADMRIETAANEVRYLSERRGSGSPPAAFSARYRGVGEPASPAAGTLDYFLTERYCLFTIGGDGEVLRVDIHHPPWVLRPATADIAVNSMAAAAGLAVPDTAPLLHLAARQDVVAWMPRRERG